MNANYRKAQEERARNQAANKAAESVSVARSAWLAFLAGTSDSLTLEG